MRQWIIAPAIVLILLIAGPLAGQNVDEAKRVMIELDVALGPIYRTEAGAGLFTQALAERLACVDERWGRKSRNGGPISHDRIAYRIGAMTPDGRNVAMRVIDYCIRCGVPEASLGWIDEGVITDQQFRPVMAAGCGGEPDHQPPTPPPVSIGPTLEEIRIVVHDELAPLGQSLEEHRAESRKTRDQVMGWLKNWRNYVTVAGGLVAGLLAR